MSGGRRRGTTLRASVALLCCLCLGADARAQDASGDLLAQARQLAQSGDLDEAEALLRRALELREGALGPDHPDLTPVLQQLASLLEHRGRWAEAASLYEHSLRIRERTDPNDLTLSDLMSRLAAIYRQLGRPAEAEAHFAMAKAILEAQCTGRERVKSCRESILSYLESKDPDGTESQAPPSATPNAARVHRAQVAARQDRQEAIELLAALRASHAQLLGGLAARIASADLEERGVWYRVQIGEFPDVAGAKALCDELARRGQEGCWVIVTDD